MQAMQAVRTRMLTPRVTRRGCSATLHARAGAGALIATSPLGLVQVNATTELVHNHPILDMTGRPRTHHFIIVYLADRPEKEVDVNNGRAVSYIV